MTDWQPHGAQLARGALAQGHGATLLVCGGPAAGPGEPLFLQDHGGRPTFVCGDASPLVGHLGEAALLRLAVPERPELTVVLGGRLRALRRGGCARHRTALFITLDLEQIVLREEFVGRRPCARVTVPVEAYLGALDGSLSDFAADVVEHTNRCHQPELRRHVADRTGRALGDIAGVSLVRIDAEGCLLCWIDGDGSHTLRVYFDEPAHTPEQLRQTLHHHLR